MSRLIDADAFDRWLANAEFTAALNNADDNDRPFEHEAMYYSTQSFRDVMSYRPTVDAIPMWWITEKFLDVLNKDKELSKAVWLVRKAWQEEQEAQNVGT